MLRRCRQKFTHATARRGDVDVPKLDVEVVCNVPFMCHQMVDSHRSVSNTPHSSGCLMCGAYATVRAGRLKRKCERVRTLQVRRQREPMLAEKHPAHPHAALRKMSRPTSNFVEVERVDRVRTAIRPGKLLTSVPKSGRSEVLLRSGFPTRLISSLGFRFRLGFF